MSYKQIVQANTAATDGVAWCLRHTQRVFNVSPQYPTARKAWDGQQGRHTDVPPLGIDVPIWYSWHGSLPGFGYQDLGHVCTRLADGRVLTSPFYAWQGGQAIYKDMDALMQALRAQGGSPKYLGWSEWLHDVQIVEKVKEMSDMPKHSRIKYRPKTPRKIGKDWKYLTINDKCDVTTLSGGSNGRHVIAFCNIDASAPLQIRALAEVTSADGKIVNESRETYYADVPKIGTYVMPLDIPKGYRLRFQARSLDGKDVDVYQMGYVHEYWEL